MSRDVVSPDRAIGDVQGDTTRLVRAAVDAVEDPEMQPITIGELGMIVDVAVVDGVAEIDIMPTFTGCPATAYIGHDARAAALSVAGVTDATVRWRRDLSWGPERITETGRAKLTETGIAPPGSGQSLENALLGIGGVRCPYCGSRNTRADSPFGSAPCRSTHSCRECKTPFDAIKPI